MKASLTKTRILLIFLCLTAIFLAFYFIYKDSKKDELSYKPGQKIPEIKKIRSILILGTDSLIPGKLKSFNSRSDFIALLYLNPKDQKVSIVSIPRDTLITLKNYKEHRINTANQIGGYKLSMRAVQKLLKTNVDDVVVFSIQAVIDLLSELGPMKIFVPKLMKYDDFSANLHINIEPGLQELHGQKLMHFLRYRDSYDGDIGRIRRQQIFFRAAIKEFERPEMIFKVPNLLYRANKAFLTDMSFKEMFELGVLLRSLPVENYESYIVPGDFGSDGSWISHKTKLQSMMMKIKNGSSN